LFERKNQQAPWGQASAMRGSRKGGGGLSKTAGEFFQHGMGMLSRSRKVSEQSLWAIGERKLAEKKGDRER